LVLVCLAAAQLVTVGFFAWRIGLHALVIVILTAGVAVTWFVPRRVVTLVLGATLLAGAVATTILKEYSEIGYTAAVLTLVTGAFIAWRE
jgi:hypothetical protein